MRLGAASQRKQPFCRRSEPTGLTLPCAPAGVWGRAPKPYAAAFFASVASARRAQETRLSPKSGVFQRSEARKKPGFFIQSGSGRAPRGRPAPVCRQRTRTAAVMSATPPSTGASHNSSGNGDRAGKMNSAVSLPWASSANSPGNSSTPCPSTSDRL